MLVVWQCCLALYSRVFVKRGATACGGCGGERGRAARCGGARGGARRRPPPHRRAVVRARRSAAATARVGVRRHRRPRAAATVRRGDGSLRRTSARSAARFAARSETRGGALRCAATPRRATAHCATARRRGGAHVCWSKFPLQLAWKMLHVGQCPQIFSSEYYYL